MKTCKKSSATTSEMNIEQWPIDKLMPYVNNPRKNDHAVAAIAGAISEFGFRVPVIAKSDGTIVDGHLRLKAAYKLGLKTVPVILADDLTELQVKAFRISVNKMADLATWDNDLLKVELATLQEEDFDILLTGFGEDEMKALLSDVEFTPNLPDEDAPESIKKYLLTITCEDSEAQESLFRELNEKGFKVKAS